MKFVSDDADEKVGVYERDEDWVQWKKKLMKRILSWLLMMNR